MQGSVETEVKIRISDIADMVKTLRAAGFSESKPRVFEENVLYDRKDGTSLRSTGMLLRLRRAGEKCVITWKGKGEAGPHKSRPEVETSIGSIESMEQMLNHLGFRRTFRYEKYRTEYESKANPGGTVTVDETPIGGFLELEGEADWIDRVAGLLGYSQADYLLESYGGLFQAYCAERGIAPTDMVFES